MSAQNINLVRKLFDLYNKNDIDRLNAIEEILAPNLQLHDPSIANKSGPQALLQAESCYIKAFPNKMTKIDQIFANEDQVVVRWITNGTHRGEYQGSGPTNKNFKISGISIYRISNGKISEIWQIWDRLGFLEQIGEIRLAKAVH